jgi:hypothetical protein
MHVQYLILLSDDIPLTSPVEVRTLPQNSVAAKHQAHRVLLLLSKNKATSKSAQETHKVPLICL